MSTFTGAIYVNAPKTFGELKFFAVQPVTARNEAGVQVQQTHDEKPDWKIICATLPTDGTSPQMVEIKLAQVEKPEFMSMTSLQFAGLTARYWAVAGRSGISFRAEAVRAAVEEVAR